MGYSTPQGGFLRWGTPLLRICTDRDNCGFASTITRPYAPSAYLLRTVPDVKFARIPTPSLSGLLIHDLPGYLGLQE